MLATKVLGNGTTSTRFTTTGLVNGDVINSLTLTSAGGNPNAGVLDGPYSITPSALLGSSRVTTDNYDISYVAGSMNVTPKTVTISATKTYDGTTALSGNQVTIATGVGSETLTYTDATVNSANAGNTYILSLIHI